MFEGRYKALHVDRDAYLLEVCRYVDLNPVRAGLVESPVRWAWSSYRANCGAVPSPWWLATRELHALVSERLVAGRSDIASGRCYAAWVAAGRGARLWANSLRMGQYLGDDAFVERVRRAANGSGAS